VSEDSIQLICRPLNAQVARRDRSRSRILFETVGRAGSVVNAFDDAQIAFRRTAQEGECSLIAGPVMGGDRLSEAVEALLFESCYSIGKSYKLDDNVIGCLRTRIQPLSCLVNRVAPRRPAWPFLSGKNVNTRRI
jgi:hypothetical protein